MSVASSKRNDSFKGRSSSVSKLSNGANTDALNFNEEILGYFRNHLGSFYAPWGMCFLKACVTNVMCHKQINVLNRHAVLFYGNEYEKKNVEKSKTLRSNISNVGRELIQNFYLFIQKSDIVSKEIRFD